MLFKNMIVEGKVIEVSERSFSLELKNNFTGIVFIDEISDYFVNDIKKIVCLDSVVTVEVLKVNRETNIAICSFKSIRPILLKNPFEFNLKETKLGFNNLLNKCWKEIDKWKN